MPKDVSLDLSGLAHHFRSGADLKSRPSVPVQHVDLPHRAVQPTHVFDAWDGKDASNYDVPGLQHQVSSRELMRSVGRRY